MPASRSSVPDPVPDLVGRAVKAVIQENLDEAESLLALIDVEDLTLRRKEAIEAAVVAVGGAGESPSHRPPSQYTDSRRGYLNVDVFRRDSFICRYCLKRTVYLPVLRQLSMLLPAGFSYLPNWKFGASHIVYWTHSSSWDHVVAKKRGGSDSWTNVVTA